MTRAALLLLLLAPAASSQDYVIQAERIYTAVGDPIEDGALVVSDGTIAGFSGGRGEKLEVYAVTPGFVDLSPGVDTGQYSVEQEDEVAATFAVDDTLDFFSHRWQRELESGVTTVLASPLDLNVVGGLASVVKTGGEPTLDARLVKQAAVLRASIGTQPSNGNRTPSLFSDNTIYTRRPTTRMGVEWVLRKAYYDAINAQRFDLDVDAEQEAENAVLLRTIEGDLPVMVKAPANQDSRTAMFLKEEFGIRNMILDEACEAWKELALVQRSGVAVVLPPFPTDGRYRDPYIGGRDSYFVALDAAQRLHDAGVTIALSGDGAWDPETRIARQAGFAMRGGLSFEAALAAVTINPARMIGVDDRVGSIEAGKDADLVLWSGPPFEPTSGIVAVFLNGELVVDRRKQEEGS